MRNFFVGYVAFDDDGPIMTSISLQFNVMPALWQLMDAIKEQFPSYKLVSVVSISEWNDEDYFVLNQEDFRQKKIQKN